MMISLLPEKIKKIPLRQEFRRPFFGLVVLSAIVLCFFTARLTYSAITDHEKSLGNIFGASNLDITISTPDFSPKVTPDDESKTDFEIQDNTSIIFQYIISFKNFSGDSDLCEKIDLKAYLDDNTMPSYDDPLDEFEFIASDTDPLEWKFEVSLDDDDSTLENQECDFDIIVQAWQKEMDVYPEGYSDIETVSAKISSGSWSTSPAVVINEIMWMGSDITQGDKDEWIELRNTTDQDIDLSNWDIEGAGTGGGHIEIPTGYTIKANGYFLIMKEKLADSAIKISTLAVNEGNDQVSGMGLDDDGEILTLEDKDDKVIDTAWKDGNTWPAGTNTTLEQSMERKDDPEDGTQASEWKTCTDPACNDGTYWDSANGNNYGTPLGDNK